MRRRSRTPGFTLVEVLIVVALIALLMGGVLLGPGMVRSSRMRAAATLMIAAVRLGITRANTTGKPVRLVIDLGARRVSLEEATGRRFLREKGDTTGGAEAATDLEQKVRAESERILDVPKAPRTSFKPLKEVSDPEDSSKGRELGAGVEVVKVQTEHDEEPVTDGRAYLYFWPGGVTERAVIQLKRSGSSDEALTVIVSALTGRASIQRGRVELPPVRNDSDGEGFSEREEP